MSKGPATEGGFERERAYWSRRAYWWFVGIPVSRAATTYYCFGKQATILGTAGNDLGVGTGKDLSGPDGPDVIVGLGGEDLILGKGGDDLICGNAGNDSSWHGTTGFADLYGGAGDDKVSGGKGNDTVNGDSGVDQLSGGAGSDDVCDGFCYREVAQPDTSGGDRLFGGPGGDYLLSTVGDDYVEGGRGNDTFGNISRNGNEISDTIGSDLTDYGSDTYLGGRGDDWIYAKDGIQGNDTLDAGAGRNDGCATDPEDSVKNCEG